MYSGEITNSQDFHVGQFLANGLAAFDIIPTGDEAFARLIKSPLMTHMPNELGWLIEDDEDEHEFW